MVSLSLCLLDLIVSLLADLFVFLCVNVSTQYARPAFFVQWRVADICCTFLFASCAHPLNSVPVLSVPNAAVMTMGQCCLPRIMCAGDGAGGRTKPVNSVVYTNTPKLVPAASAHAASAHASILPAKSTLAEDTKVTKSTFVEDTKPTKSTSTEDIKPATPAGKAATKPAKAAHGFHTRLADKAAVEPNSAVDIQTHGRAAGQSTAEVGIRSPEQPGEYIPAVRTASKSASSSTKQSATSEAAGKQPLASNTEVRANHQL